MTYLVNRRRASGMGADMSEMLAEPPPDPISTVAGDLFDQFIASDNTSLLSFMVGAPAISADAASPFDNINQTTTGTSTSISDFVMINGVCKARNFPALAAVRAFQGQLNRVADAKGYSKVATDGAVGPATMTLFRKVQAAAPSGQIMGDASACVTISADVDVLGQQIQSFADALGAPTTVSGPLSLTPPSITTKSGANVIAPDAGLTGDLAKLSSVEKLALLGLAGGIGYMALRKRKTRTTPSSTRRTRRKTRRR